MSAGTIDGFAFCRNGGQLQSEFRLDVFDRLAGLVRYSEGASPVKATLIGSRDEDGRSHLDLVVEARLPMVCQRCLDVVEVGLNFGRRLDLVRGEADIPDDDVDDDGADCIVAGREMKVQELVEDEILLALPMVAMHEHCGMPSWPR